jgi:phosphohistidine phosphatase SixA
MTRSRKLIIVRHAHRNKLRGGEADNGLSAKGKAQARALAKFYIRIIGKQRPAGKQEPVIFSSAKRRCIETVEPLAKKQKTPIETLDSLNEAINGSELREKARVFHSFWTNRKEPLTLICAHGDWITAYLKLLFALELDLEKGGWIEIESREPKASNAPKSAYPQLRWIVQNPSLLED